MRDRSVTRSRIMVGGSCSSSPLARRRASPEKARGTSTAPAAAADLSAGSADQAEHNNGVTVVPTAKQYVSARQLALREGPNHAFRATTVLPPGTIVSLPTVM